MTENLTGIGRISCAENQAKTIILSEWNHWMTETSLKATSGGLFIFALALFYFCQGWSVLHTAAKKQMKPLNSTRMDLFPVPMPSSHILEISGLVIDPHFWHARNFHDPDLIAPWHDTVVFSSVFSLRHTSMTPCVSAHSLFVCT